MGYYNNDIPSYALPSPLKWGKQMQSQALKRYEKVQSTVHHKLTVRTTGLWISTSYPYLAASPDGLIDCECCEPGVVEIKCPYTLRDCTIPQLVKYESSCSELHNGACRLKLDHPYYAQVQLQMLWEVCVTLLHTLLQNSITCVLWDLVGTIISSLICF